MNWLDWLIAGVFGYYIFQGYRKGFVQQAVDVIGGVVALILAFKFYASLGASLAEALHFSQSFTNVLGFILIVVLVGGGISFLGKRWHAKRESQPVAFFDNGFGAVFGMFKAAVLLIMTLMILLSIPWGGLHNQIGASVLSGDLLRLTPLFYQLQDKALPGELPRMVVSPDGLSFRNLDLDQMKQATCIHCGAQVEYRGLVKEGMASYPQFVCPKCGRVSDGCLTFEGHHMLKGQCPYERASREPDFDCKVWPNPKPAKVRGHCPICGRTQ